MTIAPPAGPGSPPVPAAPNEPAPSPRQSHRLRYAMHQKASLGTRDFRLEGVVVPGTVHDTPTGVDFTVQSNGVSAQVANTGSPPQLFQPNIPVVVVGHFNGNAFDSNQILVKHSSSYVAAHPNRVSAPNGTKR